MNYERIYQYRFQGVDVKKKNLTWNEIACFVYKKMRAPEKIIDPAAGMCEFINMVPSKEKWAVDMNKEFVEKWAAKDVKIVVGDNLTVDLPKNYFDGIFISN